MASARYSSNRTNQLQLSTLALAFSISLGGCAANKFPVSASDKQDQVSQPPVNVVSMQEEQMLAEAAARAQFLHAQLRELEAKNVTIVRNLPAASAPKAKLGDKKLVLSNKPSPKSETKAINDRSKTIQSQTVVSVIEKLEPYTKFKVEFAPGSSILEEAKVADLVKSLNDPDRALKKIGAAEKTRFVVQVITYDKVGIDSVNRGRLKVIAGALEKAGVEPSAVRFKTKRVVAKSGEKMTGSASRIVRITRLEPPSIQS
jgi:pyrimidine deaminase RibD-like protein